MTSRKIFVLALGAMFLALCVSAEAQLKKLPRIGVLSPGSPADAASWHQAFRKGLAGLGWVEGNNITIEYRYAEGKNERIADLAAELVRMKVDLIVATTSTETLAAKKATTIIPIVMASVADAVLLGLIDNLARPGSNITGLTQIALELTGKRLELLKESVPTLTRVAVLWNPQGLASDAAWKESQRPARELKLQLYSMEASSPSDLDKAFEGAIRAQAGALAVMPSPMFVANRKRIAELAVNRRFPSVFHLPDFVNAGGLISYGPDRSDMFRRAATYVDKILKGAKPADLPVEQPMKFELLINLKTAKQIGLTIPPNVLARADRVIR